MASRRAHGEGLPSRKHRGSEPCPVRAASGTPGLRHGSCKRLFFNRPAARVATAPTFATAAETGTSISPLTQPQGHRRPLLTERLGRGLGTNTANIAGKKTITPCPGKANVPRHASAAREGVLLSLSPKAEAVCSPRPGWKAAAQGTVSGAGGRAKRGMQLVRPLSPPSYGLEVRARLRLDPLAEIERTKIFTIRKRLKDNVLLEVSLPCLTL